LLFGIAIPAGLHLVSPANVKAQKVTKGALDLAAMQADIAHLKELAPSQSHAMTDVGYQFANLWVCREATTTMKKKCAGACRGTRP